MIQILGKVVRRTGENETVVAFKERCGQALMACKIPSGAQFAGRYTEIAPGTLDALNNGLWGQAFPELPADVCFIAAYSVDVCRNKVFLVSQAEIYNAPTFVG